MGEVCVCVMRASVGEVYNTRGMEWEWDGNGWEEGEWDGVVGGGVL